MGHQTVEVKIKYTIEGWVYTCMYRPRSGVIQFPTLTPWGTYLQMLASFLASLLSGTLARIFRLITYMAQETIQDDRLWVTTLDLHTKGKVGLWLMPGILMGLAMAESHYE